MSIRNWFDAVPTMRGVRSAWLCELTEERGAIEDPGRRGRSEPLRFMLAAWLSTCRS